MNSTKTSKHTLEDEDSITNQTKKRLQKLKPHSYVLQYLNTEIKDAVGEKFRIESENSQEESGDHHNAEYCVYRIFRNERRVYKSDKLTYRDCSNSDEDNYSNQLRAPMVLEETTDDAVVYAFRTGLNEIKVYKYKAGKGAEPELIANNSESDRRRFEILQKQERLLVNLLHDPNAFRDFVNAGIERPWQIRSMQAIRNNSICVVMPQKRNEGLDYGHVERYRLCIWHQVRGMVETVDFSTDFDEPESRYHAADVSLRVTAECVNEHFMTLRVDAHCKDREWGKTHFFHVDWMRPGATHFETRLREVLFAHLNNRQLNQTKIKSSRIINFTLDPENRRTAWITADQTDEGVEYSMFSKHDLSEINQHDIEFSIDESDPLLSQRLQEEIRKIVTDPKKKNHHRKVMTG